MNHGQTPQFPVPPGLNYQPVDDQGFLKDDVKRPVNYVQWVAATGACPMCLSYAAIGPVPEGYVFGAGTAPPAHIGCQCAMEPVDMDDDGGDAA